MKQQLSEASESFSNTLVKGLFRCNCLEPLKAKG